MNDVVKTARYYGKQDLKDCRNMRKGRTGFIEAVLQRP